MPLPCNRVSSPTVMRRQQEKREITSMEFHHVGISVSNMQRSIDFYRDMLGMELLVPPFANEGPEVERVMGLVGVKVQTGIVRKGNLALELFELAAPDPTDQDPNYSVANR